MADNLATKTNIIGDSSTGFANVELKEYYEKNLMETLKSKLHLYNLCSHTSHPRNTGDTITWRLLKDLEVPTTTLAELDPGDPVKLTMVEYQAKLAQYGSWTRFSKKVDTYAIDPILSKTSALFGRQAAKMYEALIYKAACAGTNVVTSSDTTNRKINMNDIRAMRAYFKKADVEPHTGRHYVWIIAPEMEADLMALTTNDSWLEVGKYANAQQIFDGEIGEFMGFKWVVSNNLEKVGGSAADKDDFKCIVMGAEALDTVELEGESAGAPQIIFHDFDQTATPLNQYCTFGWVNEGFTCRIMRNEALVVYKAKGSTIATALEKTASKTVNGNTFGA